MKKIIQFLALVLVVFLIPFLTSLMLEINIISKHWSRQLLVLLAMLIELVVGFLATYLHIKENFNPLPNEK